MLEIGTKAPDFSLPDQNGKIHTLSEYAGKKVILYFYPKDNTPGCTRQACAFALRNKEIENKNAVVIGISKDSVGSHLNFATKYEKPTTLPIIVTVSPILRDKTVFFNSSDFTCAVA